MNRVNRVVEALRSFKVRPKLDQPPDQLPRQLVNTDDHPERYRQDGLVEVPIPNRVTGTGYGPIIGRGQPESR